MDVKENIYKFLLSKGFKLIQMETSPYFGDYYDIFTNDILGLKINCSQSFFSIDVCSIEKGDWFDLALVKALIHQDKMLNKVTTIEDYFEFLKEKICVIEELFNTVNYPNTKKNLEELGNVRAKQMFPEAFKDK